MANGCSSAPDWDSELRKLFREEKEVVRQLQMRIEHTRWLLQLLNKLHWERVIASTTPVEKVMAILEKDKNRFDHGLAVVTILQWHLSRIEKKLPLSGKEPLFCKSETLLEATNALKRWLFEQEQEGIERIEFDPPKPIRI